MLSVYVYVNDQFQFSVPDNGRTKVQVAEAVRTVLGLSPTVPVLFTLDGIYFGAS